MKADVVSRSRGDTVAKWVGAPFPENAPFQATPEALVELMDERRVPWHLQELVRRLVAMARRDNVVQITSVSIASLAARWSVDRRTLWRWLQSAASRDLISYSAAKADRSVTIGLEPIRQALRKSARSDAARLRDETASSQRRDESSHRRDHSSHGWDDSSHSQARTPAPERENKAEEAKARYSAPGNTKPIDPVLASLIESKRPRPAAVDAPGAQP